MKRYYMLLIVLALILPAVLSCQHRKSAEEGGRRRPLSRGMTEAALLFTNTQPGKSS